jgi:hypothetical protein
VFLVERAEAEVVAQVAREVVVEVEAEAEAEECASITQIANMGRGAGTSIQRNVFMTIALMTNSMLRRVYINES